MTINTPVKIVVAFVVIALIVVMFWLFDWKEKTELVEQNNAKVAELEVKLEEQRKLVADLPALTKEKTELEAELARVVQTNLVPEKAELFVANYIKEIEKLTDEEGYRTGDDSFEIISITPGALTSQAAKGSDADNTEAAEEDEGVDATPDALKQFPTRVFQMTMKGRYATLIEFLYQLGDLRLERLVTIDKITLQPETKKEGDHRSPVLTIQIPITAYMRQGG